MVKEIRSHFQNYLSMAHYLVHTLTNQTPTGGPYTGELPKPFYLAFQAIIITISRYIHFTALVCRRGNTIFFHFDVLTWPSPSRLARSRKVMMLRLWLFQLESLCYYVRTQPELVLLYVCHLGRPWWSACLLYTRAVGFRDALNCWVCSQSVMSELILRDVSMDQFIFY